MNKSEFLDRLMIALSGKIPPNQIQEHLNYYEEYINTQIRMGRSEQEVFELLGAPRLIAKTIIETSEHSGSETYGESSYQNREPEYSKSRKFFMPGWLWGMLMVLMIVGIFSMVFSVLSFLAPIMLPLLVVIFLVKLFRDWLN